MNKDLRPCVYLLTCLRTNESYVGSTCWPRRRRNFHLKRLRDGIHANRRLQEAANIHGVDSFRFRIVEDVPDVLFLTCRERFWLIRLGSAALNLYPIPIGPLWTKHSPDHRKKIGMALKGRPKCADHGAKVSAGLRGKKKTQEHINAMREAQRLRHSSDPSLKEAMRKAARRLPDALINEILAARSSASQASIARRFGVSPAYVCLLYKGAINQDILRAIGLPTTVR